LKYFESAKKVFSVVESGATISKKTCSREWKVDILARIGKEEIVIEYDGAYWHSEKTSLDTRKSIELLNAGFWVFRLREVGLAPLDITNSKYHEIVVNPFSPKTATVMRTIEAVVKCQSSLGVQYDNLR